MWKYPYKTQPYEHQRHALNSSANKTQWAYFMEMGTGKTKVTIDNFAYLRLQNKIEAILIIAPKSVYTIWENEIHSHLPNEVKHIIFKWNIDKPKYYHKFNKSTELRIFLINVEALSTKRGLDACIDYLSKNKLNFVVLDESTTIKNRSAKRTKNILKLRPLSHIRYKLKEFSTRIRKDQCLDLKPKIRQKRYIELEGETKEIYERLKQHALAIVEDSTVSFSNKLTEIVKLHQVCNGFTKNDEGEIIELNKQKLNALDEIIEETDGKIIIFANYIFNIKNIISFLEDKYGKNTTVSIYGDVDVKGRQEAVKRIQEDKNTRFIVANPTTGGFGLTLTACNTVVYFSNSYNLEVRMQSEDRAHRMGQKGSVLYIDIVAKNTLDEAIMKSLTNKGKIAAKTLGEEELRSWLL